MYRNLLLDCRVTQHCPFQYGVVALFCMPRIKKPPDPNWSGELTLVEEVIDLNNLRKMKRNEIEICDNAFNRDQEINSEDEKAKE